MQIGNYQFEGPWPLGTNFNEVAGVYVIFTQQRWLDVGETNTLGSRLNGNNHERKPQWITASLGQPIQIAFLSVTDTNIRLRIESELRSTLNPFCGER